MGEFRLGATAAAPLSGLMITQIPQTIHLQEFGQRRYGAASVCSIGVKSMQSFSASTNRSRIGSQRKLRYRLRALNYGCLRLRGESQKRFIFLTPYLPKQRRDAQWLEFFDIGGPVYWNQWFRLGEVLRFVSPPKAIGRQFRVLLPLCLSKFACQI